MNNEVEEEEEEEKEKINEEEGKKKKKNVGERERSRALKNVKKEKLSYCIVLINFMISMSYQFSACL